jgi:hypothetical protein
VKLSIVLLLLGVTPLPGQVTPINGNPGSESSHSTIAKLEGKIVNSASGMPVGTVSLTLRSNNPSQAVKYTTTSDTNGGFLFDRVAPGRYTLSAEKPGFLRQYYGARSITSIGTALTLTEGQLLKDLVFNLIPQGVISGRVTDEAGEPLSHVSVVAMQWGYSQGKRLLQPVAATLTNDLGEYRVANLRPGNYYLAGRRADDTLAGQLDVARADVPSTEMPEKPEEGYRITYYPNSNDASGAAMLQVMPGSERSGVDIQFRRSKVFRVRGQVVDDAGQPAANAKVSLMLSTPDSLLSMGSLGGPQLPQGKFEVTNVPPGAYELIAQITRNGQTLYARQPIFVSNRAVSDIVITIPRAVDVAGTVRVSELQTRPHEERQNSRQHPFLMEAIRVLFYPVNRLMLGSLPQSTVQADGSFVLRNVVPDKFRVQVSGTPPGCYLKSILIGGEERVDGTVDLTVGSKIEIILAMGAAKITGSVVDIDDKPISGATVTLVPDDQGEHGRIDLFRTATSDQDGQFDVVDVVPGNYKILAWQEVESGATQDAEFRRSFGSKAKSLTLKEDGRETARLKAIPVEDVAQALGNRPQ